jgi:hypothetical protein
MRFKIILSLLALSLILCGCSTGISQYSVTARDREKFTSKDVSVRDYSNATYVIQTKGGGQIACINIGSKDGVTKGAKIEFYEIKVKNSKKFEILFAKGKVIDVSQSTCWVEVNNYETANVMENHFARLAADQSITLGEKFKNPTLFFKKKQPPVKK